MTTRRVAWGLPLLSLLLFGCGTKMVTAPQIALDTRSEFRVPGQILYDGNRDYLPRTIAEVPVGGAVLTFRYAYEVTQGKDKMPAVLPIFNPLTIFGFPIGEDTIVVAGRLEVLKQGEVMKTYTATSALEKTRSIFWEGETFAEMRRRGLVAVRDSIEAQMYRERDLLLKLLAPE